MEVSQSLDIPSFQSTSATDFDVFTLPDQASALFQSPLVNPVPTIRLLEYPKPGQPEKQRGSSDGLTVLGP